MSEISDGMGSNTSPEVSAMTLIFISDKVPAGRPYSSSMVHSHQPRPQSGSRCLARIFPQSRFLLR